MNVSRLLSFAIQMRIALIAQARISVAVVLDIKEMKVIAPGSIA